MCVPPKSQAEIRARREKWVWVARSGCTVARMGGERCRSGGQRGSGARMRSLPRARAVEKLRQWPYQDLGFAKIDHHRALRQGFPEVIFARKKTAKQVAEIARGMLRAKASHNILITRADKKVFAAVKKLARAARFHELSGAITISRSTAIHGKGSILVVTAGT